MRRISQHLQKTQIPKTNGNEPAQYSCPSQYSHPRYPFRHHLHPTITALLSSNASHLPHPNMSTRSSLSEIPACQDSPTIPQSAHTRDTVYTSDSSFFVFPSPPPSTPQGTVSTIVFARPESAYLRPSTNIASSSSLASVYPKSLGLESIETPPLSRRIPFAPGTYGNPHSLTVHKVGSSYHKCDFDPSIKLKDGDWIQTREPVRIFEFVGISQIAQDEVLVHLRNPAGIDEMYVIVDTKMVKIHAPWSLAYSLFSCLLAPSVHIPPAQPRTEDGSYLCSEWMS